MRTVQHVACFAPPPSTADWRPAETAEARSQVTSSLDAEGRTAVVHVARHEAHAFRFDRLCHLSSDDGDTLASRVLRDCPLVTSHTTFVIHGAEGVDAYALFRSLIAALLNTQRAADSTALSPSPDTSSSSACASSFVEYSILRIYSWGATDVLRREAVEDNMSTPRRTPLFTGTTEITPARRGRASLTAEADLLPLWEALERARLVPEWHSALCCSLYIPVYCGGFGTVKLLLLPGLQRANHLLRRDLLQLRVWLAREDGGAASSTAPAATCRLKDFLTDDSSGESGEARVHVLTVMRHDTAKAEETALNAWFGSLSAHEDSHTRETFVALLGGSADAMSPRHAPPTPHRDDEALMPLCTPPRRSAYAPVASVFTQAAALATPPEAQRQEAEPDKVVSSAAATKRAEALAARLDAAERDVRDLRLVKEGLEKLVVELVAELSQVVTEVDESVDDMVAEVDRAEQALRVYQATTATEQRTELRRLERRLASFSRAPSE